MQKAMVTVLLMWSWRTEGYRIAPEIIGNVTMLLAGFYTVDCVQIFRTDNLPLSTEEEIWKTWRTLAVAESGVTTGVFTHKMYIRRKTERPWKVSCYRSMKVLSDDEDSRREHAAFSMKMTLSDAVWILYTDSSSARFFQEANVVFNDVIVIAEIKSEELILFHEVYKVARDFPLRVFRLGKWTRAGGLQISDVPMYERRSDLEGVAVRRASIENWPASYFKDGKWQGFVIKIWKEIESLINCTSVEVKAEETMGMRMKNGSWNGLVGQAARHEFDVIVSELEINKERARVLEYFHPIMRSSFQIYTRHLGYRWQWASILRPLHASVWAAVVAWILVATIFWTFIHRVCVSRGLGSMDFENSPPTKAFFFVIQTLCQQGYHHEPNSYACRVFFFVSYAVSSVLIPSYSASLVSTLRQKVQLKSFDSLQEMVADGSYLLIVKENTAQHNFFALSKDSFFKMAYEKIVKPVPESMKNLGLMQSVKALCYLDNYAVMGLEETVESRLHHMVNLDCPVVHLTKPVATVYLTMAATKYHPYWGLINHKLGKLLNMGVVGRLRRQEVLTERASTHFEDPIPEVGMRQVVSAFLFIGFLAAVSVLLLLLEVQWLCFKALGRERKKKQRVRFRHTEGRLGSQARGGGRVQTPLNRPNHLLLD